MKEGYPKSYIATPINESPLLDWLKKINTHRQFFHMSLYLLGQVADAEIPRIKDTVLLRSQILKGLELKPNHLEIIGDKNQFFVLKIETTEQMVEARRLLEEDLRFLKKENPSLLPHITIQKPKRYVFSYSEKKYLSGIEDISMDLPPYPAKLLEIYYKPKNGETPVLFSVEL
jgi:2'-5' RNA ligase